MSLQESNIVTINGQKCTVQFGYYGNHTIALDLFYKEEPFLRATVNWEQNFEGADYRKECRLPIVVIKNYGENAGIYDQLLQAGVINLGPYLSGTNGTVQLGILTDKWLKIAKEQLSKIDGAGH